MNPYKAKKNALFCINDPCQCAICFDCCLKMVTAKASSLCLTDLPRKFRCPLCNIEDNMNVDSAGKEFSDWIVRHVAQELPKLNKEVANRCMNISTYRFRNAKFMVTELQQLSTIQVRNITDLAEFVWRHVDVGREDTVAWKLRNLSKALGLLDRGAYPNTTQYETEIQLEAHHYKGMKLLFLDAGNLFFHRSEELFSDLSSAEIKRRYPFFQTLRKIYDNRGQVIEGEPIDLTCD